MRPAWIRQVGLAVLLGLALTGGGCKEGDPLSADTTPATPDFEPATVPAHVTERFVTLRTHSVVGSRITLDVVVHEVDLPLTAVNIKLRYPDTFSKFTTCSDGDLFPPGPCFFSEPGPGSGEVFLSRVALGDSQATAVSGERVAMRVEFLVFGLASGEIVIEGQNFGAGETSALEGVGPSNIIEAGWYSGDLVGR